MRTYKEVTADKGWEMKGYASDNNATYILTSARAHDMYDDFEERYARHPTSRWFNRHFMFERID